MSIYWIEGSWPGKIAVSPRPRGDDWLALDMAEWKKAGVGVVLSLLTAAETSEFALKDEGREARAHGMEFVSYPIPDLQVPSSKTKLAAVLDQLGAGLTDGKNILIHCRQGIGRSGLVAALLMVSKGLSPGAAVEQVSVARGRPVPETPEQREWIDQFATVSTSTSRR